MEDAKKTRRNTRIVLALVLLSGILHSFQAYLPPFFDTLIYTIRYTLHTGILLYWLQSVRHRLVRSTSRTALLMAGCLLIAMEVISCCKYRFMDYDREVEILLWYLYYVPMLMVTTLFFLAGLSFLESDRRRFTWKYWILVHPVFLCAGILTNSLHYLAFKPLPGTPALMAEDGTYSYGILYYMAVAWIAASFAAGLVCLLRAAKGQQPFRRILGPLLCLGGIGILESVNAGVARLSLRRFYNFPELFIFCMMGAFELCIRARLIPFNENYEGFFHALRFPVAITDKGLRTMSETSEFSPVSEEKMKAALTSPIALSEDILLRGRQVRSGYAFWTEDESVLHSLEEELESAKETLSLENRLIRIEQEQKEEQARIEASNAIYEKAAAEVHTAQRRIADLLEGLTAESEDFAAVTAHVCVLNAYVKRKTNLVLLTQDKGRIPIREMYLALDEMARYLKYLGINASVEVQGGSSFSSKTALLLYDCFAGVVEMMLPGMHSLLVFLRQDGLRLTTDGDLPEEVPPFSLPYHTEREEGLLYLTIRAETGGAYDQLS